MTRMSTSHGNPKQVLTRKLFHQVTNSKLRFPTISGCLKIMKKLMTHFYRGWIQNPVLKVDLLKFAFFEMPYCAWCLLP